jgi:hypothetical protein
MDFVFGPVESLEQVPEQFRSLYATEAKDGKYNLLDPHKGVGEAFTGLNKALKAEREASRKRPVVDLSLLAEYGDSVEKIKDGFGIKLKELNDQLAAGGKVNIDKVKQEFMTAHQGELTKLGNRNTALQEQLYRHLVVNAATAACLEAKGDAELLLPFIKQTVKVVEEDNEFKVLVVDAEGNRRFSGVTGAPLTLTDLVAEMKVNKKYAKLFESEAPSGGGTPPGPINLPKKGRTDQPKSPTELIAAGLRKGKIHGTNTPSGMR